MTNFPACMYDPSHMVDPRAAGTCTEVTALVEKRMQGGAHGVIFQKPTGRYACASCVALLRRGVSPEQTTMLV